MKHIVITILSLYQKLISPLIEQILGTRDICRFSPTCSEYAKIAIQRDGVLKGGYLAAKRILKCQPYYTHKTI